MDAVEQPAMVRADIADDVQSLEPARQLRCAQPAHVSDCILDAARCEAVQSRQAAPAEQLDRRPDRQDPAVLRVMVFDEVLA